MKQSFIVPLNKPLLSLFSRIWLFFIVFVSFVILAFSAYISLDSSSLREATVILTREQESLEQRADETDEAIKSIIRQKVFAEEIFLNNTLLKESIKNLFNLVPEKITLERVEMQQSSLVLEGITPTQDVFNFLLSVPLRSIFHTSQTTFQTTPQGESRFISVNRIISSTKETERE